MRWMIVLLVVGAVSVFGLVLSGGPVDGVFLTLGGATAALAGHATHQPKVAIPGLLGVAAVQLLLGLWLSFIG